MIFSQFLSTIHLIAATGDPCKAEGGNFFGLPTWYKYLSSVENKDGICSPALTGLNDIWLIALAIIEILLRIAVAFAVAYLLIGGFKFITSRANPDKTSAAKNTVVDAIIGLVVAISATAVVSFIAGRFSE